RGGVAGPPLRWCEAGGRRGAPRRRGGPAPVPRRAGDPRRVAPAPARADVVPVLGATRAAARAAHGAHVRVVAATPSWQRASRTLLNPRTSGRGVGAPAKRRRGRRRAGRQPWPAWSRGLLEVAALAVGALIGVPAAVGSLAGRLAGDGLWSNLLPFAAAVLGLGLVAALLLRTWLAVRPRLERTRTLSPAAVALTLAAVAVLVATRPGFQEAVATLRGGIGGPVEAPRPAVAAQVYAAYRRADLHALERVLERARVYEATVREAANAFGVDPEVLMGLGSAESAFYPRDSADGGRGLFQITAPPAAAVAEVRRRLGVEELDPLNQRHNAYLAAATLRLYLDQMHGDPFLGLLAYNIGPRNGGLRAIMAQYGARDFTTIQPYLHPLPRDYPSRVLSGALAYRLWHSEGHLPRYEEGSNALHIQRVGIPGLEIGPS